MRKNYFKARKAFSFKSNPYDIGTALGLWHNHDDNHFLLKIYLLSENNFKEFYNYHLSYAVKCNIVEEDFYQYVWKMVDNRIRHYEIQDPFSRNHGFCEY